jgi:hypothetical protein
MSSTDALPVPRKNAAYRLTFGIFKSDGTLITGATGLDSEVSKDAGTFADCTAEATEIATSSGVYYLDLSSTEMNADTVCVLVKSSSTGAVPVVITLYPQEAGDIRVNPTYWNDTAVATPTTAGVPEVDVTYWTGEAVIATTATGVPRVDISRIAGIAASASNLEKSASTIVRGTVDNASFTPTTTAFESDDVTEATTSHYVGRNVIFTSGALLGQAARITAYQLSGANGKLTVTTMTEAPANNDTFVIV